MILIVIISAILGAVLGSFACCQACRLRIKEKGGKNPGPRSICLRCRHQLKWFDNIPIISWLTLRGRCRYCRKPIGLAEILSEISMAIIVALITLYYGYASVGSSSNAINIASCLVLIFIVTIFWILLLYDAQYSLLPTSLLLIAIVAAAIFRILNLDYSVNLWPQLIDLFSAITLLAGLYYVLYIVSHEKWVGSGDWLLALAIALILGNWWLALIELTVSNALALGGILAQSRHQKNHSAPFAPYLIIACIAIFLLQDIINLPF